MHNDLSTSQPINTHHTLQISCQDCNAMVRQDQMAAHTTACPNRVVCKGSANPLMRNHCGGMIRHTLMGMLPS